MAVRVVVSGTHLYFVQCLRNLIKNLKPYSIQFNDGCYNNNNLLLGGSIKLQSKTAPANFSQKRRRGWGKKNAKVPDFD